MRKNAPADLKVDWAACQGHGLCAELLPDHVTLDDWGYPIVSGPISPAAAKRAHRAVVDCPALALKLKAVQAADSTGGTLVGSSRTVSQP
jgi:ferredoxin